MAARAGADTEVVAPIYQATTPILADGSYYAPGDNLEISEQQASRLLELEAIVVL